MGHSDSDYAALAEVYGSDDEKIGEIDALERDERRDERPTKKQGWRKTLSTAGAFVWLIITILMAVVVGTDWGPIALLAFWALTTTLLFSGVLSFDPTSPASPISPK